MPKIEYVKNMYIFYILDIKGLHMHVTVAGLCDDIKMFMFNITMFM